MVRFDLVDVLKQQQEQKKGRIEAKKIEIMERMLCERRTFYSYAQIFDCFFSSFALSIFLPFCFVIFGLSQREYVHSAAIFDLPLPEVFGGIWLYALLMDV